MKQEPKDRHLDASEEANRTKHFSDSATHSNSQERQREKETDKNTRVNTHKHKPNRRRHDIL